MQVSAKRCTVRYVLSKQPSAMWKVNQGDRMLRAGSETPLRNKWWAKQDGKTECAGGEVKWHLEFWLWLLLAGDALAGVWVGLMLPLRCAVIHWWFRSWCWRCRCSFVRVEVTLKTLEWLKSHRTVVSNLFGNRDQFCRRQFFHELSEWFNCITFIVHCISIIIISAQPQIIRH